MMRNNLISSRLRIARNIADYPFTTMMNKSTSKTLMEQYGKVYMNLLPVSEMNVLETQYLLERGVFSKEMLSFNINRGLVKDRDFCLLLNEEDHLRFLRFSIGDMSSGQIQALIDEAIRLNEFLEYAYDEQLGFLTASVLNVGTGIKYSKMIHLPALVANKYIDRVRYTASQLGITINEYKNSINGNLFIIGNLKTLGVSEEEIIGTVDRVVEQLLKLEIDAERVQVKKHRAELEDRIFRSYGLLKYSRMLSIEEAYINLSNVLLGVNVDLIQCTDVDELKRLFFNTLESSLNKGAGRILSVKDRQVERANSIRKALEGTYEIQS